MKPFAHIAAIAESQQLSKLLLVGYGLFYAGFFLVPRALENYHQGFYYLGLALVGLLLVPEGLRLLRTNLVFWLLFSYLLYMVATSLWTEGWAGDPEMAKRSLKYLQRALYILFFFLLTAVLRKRHPVGFDNMLKLVCIAAGVSSLITLFLWYSTHPFPESRVWGFSLVRWTIFAAYSFGVFAVISVYFIFRTSRLWMRAALMGSFLALFSYVWLAQSRAAFGATLLGVILASLGGRRRHSAVILLAVAVVLAVTSLLFIPDAAELVFSRGLSFRPQIWSAYIERAMDAPFFGEGYFCDPRNFVYSPPKIGWVPDAHSGYFGTLRDGGLVGLALLLGTFGAALVRAVQSAWRTGSFLSLALAVAFMAFMLTDSDRLITRTGGPWLFVWLPLAIIMTGPVGKRDGREDRS